MTEPQRESGGMDDFAVLTALNERFVDAFRTGSWALLEPILSPDFSYLDGATGEVWPMDRYIADIEHQPVATIEIDQVRVHVDGDTAVVSARSSTRPDQFNRHVDTYERRDGGWLCVHACVSPLSQAFDERSGPGGLRSVVERMIGRAVSTRGS